MFADDGKKIIVISLAVAALIMIAANMLASFPLKIVSIVVVAWFAFTLWFFRDPERKISAEKNSVVSPADGTIVRVDKQASDDELGEGQIVSIFMSVFSVHVNRSPLDGKVIRVTHSDGKFVNAMKAEASFVNENVNILIEADKFKFRVIQIAGLIARRIVPYVKVGDEVKRGQRIGMIKFGSKVDMFFPPNIDISVEVGQKVFAGKSVIGVLND